MWLLPFIILCLQAFVLNVADYKAENRASLATGGCGSKVPERVANKVQMLVFGTNFVIWGC